MRILTLLLVPVASIAVAQPSLAAAASEAPIELTEVAEDVEGGAGLSEDEGHRPPRTDSAALIRVSSPAPAPIAQPPTPPPER